MALPQKSFTNQLMHLAEPKLTFAYGQKLSDPRDGLLLFGPPTKRHFTGQINVGIIGPPLPREELRNYLRRIHAPVFGGETEVARPFFPGIESTFGVFVNFENLPEINIEYDEIKKFLKYTDGHQRVYNLCNLYVDALLKYTRHEEMPVTVWFVVIPDEVYQYGRPQSKIPTTDKNVKAGLTLYERISGQMLLFSHLDELRSAYDFEVNFHNQLKAKLLADHIVTQVIRESTIAYERLWTSQRKIDLERKFDTAKAWNIATTLYYKAGGLPWKLADVRLGVCYLGLVYKKVHTDTTNRNACCAAQMFLDSGDGVVFKGNLGPWYNPETREFHIRQDDAVALLNQSLESFRARSDTGSFPTEVFIHARTAFDDDEWSGFAMAAAGKSKIVGVRIRDNRVFKLYREFTYAVPRGTVYRTSQKHAYLWSRGFIPRLQTQLGLETPNPLEVEISRGDTDIQQVCQDVLALTKLNYNSCLYGDGLPVTLRFADRIGEVLTAGKDITNEVLTFKYYV